MNLTWKHLWSSLEFSGLYLVGLIYRNRCLLTMVVRYVSFKRLVHVLVKWFPLRHGSRDYHKLALHVLFIEFCPCFVYWLALMGEVLPVVCEMTSPTTWFGGDDHNSVILVTGLSITSSCLARFRQLFVTWLPQPDGSRDDPKYCSHEVYRWPARFCITSEVSPVVCDMTSSTRKLEGWPQMFSRVYLYRGKQYMCFEPHKSPLNLNDNEITRSEALEDNGRMM